MTIDVAPYMPAVAELLFGQRNKELSTKGEWRYGSHGSLSIKLAAGTWHDHEADEGGGVLDLIAREQHCDRGHAMQWLLDHVAEAEEAAEADRANGHARPNGHAKFGQQVAEYNYVNERGELVFQVVRFADPKKFRQRRSDPGRPGDWIWNLDGIGTRPLYRLPELLAADPSEIVYLCEGEKDVDRLRSLGLTATTTSQGAKSWDKSDHAPLRGRHVVILPDNDDAGRGYLKAAAEELAGKAASVRMVDLPGLPPKGDVSDWLDAGGTAAALAEIVARVKAPRPSRPRSMAEFAGKPVPTLRYAVPMWIPLGKPVLFCGRGAAGKTTLACQLAAARAIGAPFLGMDVPSGKSLVVLCEEDEEDVHRLLARFVDNHFNKGFADFADAYFWGRSGEDNALVWCNRGGQVQPTPFHALLAEQIKDTKPDLLVLDNARHVALINENDNAVVTAAWAILHQLMVATGGTTLLLGHVPKNGTAEFAGGASWENVARSRIYLGPLKADDDEQAIENDPRRILRRGKANASGTASLEIVLENGAFRLEDPGFSTYGDKLDREMRKGQACQAFLDALATLTEQRRATSHGPSARNFAPRTMKTAKLAEAFTLAELTEAMEALFKEGRIKAGLELWRGPDRHPVVGIGRCTQ